MQQGAQVHRPLPRGARDLVVTAAAMAATRCWARSASPCASPRCMARDEGWLAEHMLILGVEGPRGREDLRRRRLPQRLRQDQLRHADPARSVPEEGWKVTTVGDDIAWIKPGAGRQALRHQPRGRLLRRGARHLARHPTPTRWRRSAANTIFTNVALTDDGDVWWEGMTEDAARAPDRLDRPGLDAGQRPQGRASQRALHRAGSPVPVHRPGLGGPAGRADHGVHLRRPARQHGAAGLPGVQLELRRLRRRHHGLGDDRGRRRPAAARCAATRSPCCRSAATTWPTTSTTGCSSGGTIPNPPRIFGVNWFRTRRQTASSSGPASARTCAC